MRIAIYKNYECNATRSTFMGKFRSLDVFMINWEKIIKKGCKVRFLFFKKKRRTSIFQPQEKHKKRNNFDKTEIYQICKWS